MYATIKFEREGDSTIYVIYVNSHRVASFKFLTLAHMYCRRMGLKVVQ